jgi:hypothetical protein
VARSKLGINVSRAARHRSGDAARGGFYGWLTRPRSQRSRSDEDVGAKVGLTMPPALLGRADEVIE